jgi:hypothetical protein
MTPVTPRALTSALRSAVSRRDLRAFARAARAAGPEVLVRAWPRLRPLERAAAFRALDTRAAAAAFAALPVDGRWLAYLAEVSEGAAPLLEGARPSEARLLRRAGTAERARMRRTLSRTLMKGNHPSRSGG